MDVPASCMHEGHVALDGIGINFILDVHFEIFLFPSRQVNHSAGSAADEMASPPNTIMEDLLRPLAAHPSDRAACLAALRQLQDDVLPRAAAAAAAAAAASSTPLLAAHRLLVMGGKEDDDNGDGDNGTDANNNSLGCTLLRVVGDSSVAEICRERAILLLKSLLLQSVAASDEQDSDDNCCADDYSAIIRSRRYMMRYYGDYCATVCRRIVAPSSSSSKPPVGERTNNDSCEREPSETIRLELLLALSPLLGLLPNTDEDDGQDGEDSDDAMVVEEASSKLCLAMTQGCCPALLDPYTAIHRESCHIIMQLAAKSPSVVARHSSELLAKLVGASTAGDQNTPAGTCAGLMTHRQAKTRCIAVDAVAAIILCCCDGDGTRSGTDASRIGALLESAHVLTRWEDGPAFDRSAQVRLSVQRSVGKVSRVIFLDAADDDDQNEKNGPMMATASNASGRPSTSSVGRRLISLLLVGERR